MEGEGGSGEGGGDGVVAEQGSLNRRRKWLNLSFLRIGKEVAITPAQKFD